jgi:hypothetical protein
MPQTKKRQREYMKERIANPKYKKIRRRKESNKRAERLISWHQYKFENFKCVLCGERHPACLEFHHINPKIKENTIAQIVRHGLKESIIENLTKEINKCMPVCSNCHSKIHFEETYGKFNLESC